MCVVMLGLLAPGELEPRMLSTKRSGSLLARLCVGLGVVFLVCMVTYRPPRVGLGTTARLTPVGFVVVFLGRHGKW